MSDRGIFNGTHHLTFCVRGAQEDYDFHAGPLDLRFVKKTVLFDGEIPIYHLYYGNTGGDASTLLTSFPTARRASRARAAATSSRGSIWACPRARSGSGPTGSRTVALR